jgi:hypothetical protein
LRSALSFVPLFFGQAKKSGKEEGGFWKGEGVLPRNDQELFPMDVIKLTQDMVAFNSSSSLSNAEVSDYIQRQLRRIGFQTELVTYDDRGV